MPDYLCTSCGALLENRDIRIAVNREQPDEPFSHYNHCIPCGSGEVVEIEPKAIAETCAHIALELTGDPHSWGDAKLRMFENWKQLTAYFLEVW